MDERAGVHHVTSFYIFFAYFCATLASSLGKADRHSCAMPLMMIMLSTRSLPILHVVDPFDVTYMTGMPCFAILFMLEPMPGFIMHHLYGLLMT